MARFFVGQRVRVIHQGQHWSRETVIRAIDVKGADGGRYFYNGIQVDIPHRVWEWCVFEPHELIPILPAHEPVAISALLEEFPSLSGVLGVVA